MIPTLFIFKDDLLPGDMTVDHLLSRPLMRILICLVLGWTVGCIGQGVPTGTVDGKVTYKGKPAPEGCLVSFISDKGYAALGTVDASGHYKLVIAGKTEIPAVTYNVSVTVPGIQGPEMSEEDERKFMAGDPATVAKFSQKQQKPTLPEKYSDPIRSGLSFEIKKGSNTFDIALQ